MYTLNGVRNGVGKGAPVINGGKQARINANYPYDYDKWRMAWNGNHLAPPEPGSVLYLPGVPGQGSVIQDFSYNFTDSGIDTDEELDAVETGVNCDADATTAIPIGSIIIVESEWMLVSATGTTLTVTRGYHGTTAATHATNQDIRTWKPNNGTIAGAVWTRLPSGLWVLDFDGTDDYVSCANAASLNLAPTCYMGAWIKLDVLGVVQEIIAKWENPNYSYVLRVLNTNYLQFYSATNGADLTSLTASTTLLTTGVWYLVGYSNGALFVNDVQQTVVGSVTASFFASAIATQLGAGEGATALNELNGQIALPLITTATWTIADHSARYQQERHLAGV